MTTAELVDQISKKVIDNSLEKCDIDNYLKYKIQDFNDTSQKAIFFGTLLLNTLNITIRYLNVIGIDECRKRLNEHLSFIDDRYSCINKKFYIMFLEYYITSASQEKTFEEYDKMIETIRSLPKNDSYHIIKINMMKMKLYNKFNIIDERLQKIISETKELLTNREALIIEISEEEDIMNFINNSHIDNILTMSEVILNIRKNGDIPISLLHKIKTTSLINDRDSYITDAIIFNIKEYINEMQCNEDEKLSSFQTLLKKIDDNLIQIPVAFYTGLIEYELKFAHNQEISLNDKIKFLQSIDTTEVSDIEEIIGYKTKMLNVYLDCYDSNCIDEISRLSDEIKEMKNY